MSSGRSAGRSGGRASKAERAAGKTDTAAAGSGGGGNSSGGSQNHQEKPAAKPHTHHSKLVSDNSGLELGYCGFVTINPVKFVCFEIEFRNGINEFICM